jgi:O-antigen ligase
LVINFIGQRPILGYGYSGFWAGASPESAVVDEVMDQVISYSHNGYLEILLTLGAVGLFFTLCILGAGIKRAYGYSKGDRGGMEMWPLAFLLYFLLHNITECTILLQDLEWAMCVAIVVGADPAMFAHNEEPVEEMILVPSEEMT